MVNPVLVNDLRKSLIRRKPVVAVALMAAAILVLTFGMFVIPMGMLRGNQQAPWWRFLDIALPIVAPAFAAGAFAKEHEQRTWQDVMLTRLSAFEILSGKFGACLLPTLTTILVLFPPFAMLLILQNVNWAMDPGPWMLIVGFKFLVSATFYLAVVLVCSYHSANTRTALVVGYIVLGLYAAFNYALWRFFILPFFLIPYWMETRPNFNEDRIAPWEVSNQQFSLSLLDTMNLTQAILLSLCLFLYLFTRLRRRA